MPQRSVVRSVRFYCLLYWAAIRARAEYRVDFVFGMLTAMLTQLAALSFYWIVFSQSSELGGWSGPEVLFLFGFAALVLSLSELFLNGIWQLPDLVRRGDFDRLRLYPVRSLLFLLVSQPELHALGNFIAGSAMIACAWWQVPPPAPAFVLLPFWVIAGTLIYTSALVMLGCLVFWTLGSLFMHYMIAYQLLNAARYPAHIFPSWFKTVIVFVFPIAVPSFLPGLWFRGQLDWFWVVIVPPLVALVSMCLASLAWASATRSYQSTGS